MKLTLPILTAHLLAAGSLTAANIAWVTPHPAENTPSAAAATAGATVAPDAGYTALLTAQGHNVTRILVVADLQNYPDTIAALNTNDLIIISRSCGSGSFDTAAETAAWNTSITKPLISLGGYINRNNRLGFNTGDTIPDVNSATVRLRVSAPTHPIFDGLALDSSSLMVNGFAQLVTFTNSGGTNFAERGISVVTSAVRGGGSTLATIGTAGDAAVGGMAIGEFPAGMTTHRDVLGAKRLVFLTGSREHAAAPTSGDLAGFMDLTPDGKQLFLNAVTYLTSPQRPRCTLPLVGATNLVAGDIWSFAAGVIGDAPLTYQWYHDGLPMATGTSAGLNFTSLTTADAGSYYLVVTNATGAATSTVARLDFYVFPPTSITNGIISCWPLDNVLGTKTVDLVSGYDMTMVNMGATNLTPGKWGNAMTFDNAKQTILERINKPGEDLPIYNNPNFSVSIWVNGGYQSDHRVFAEGNTTNATPLFDLGTHNAGTDGSVDIYLRNNSGVISSDHRHTTNANAFDYVNWHNVVYVQRDVGNGNMKAQVWIDGVLDPLTIAGIRPLTLDATAIGGLRRASASAWFTGMIDEVAVWNRALSGPEIGILQVTPITNAPSRLQPLAINRFRADLSTVGVGQSTSLRWDVSKDVTQVLCTPLGDVTADTLVGIGSRTITPAATTTYVLTIKRGVDTLSATTSVAVISGVTTGWNLLDNFDQYPPGNLAANGYWSDATGGSASVLTVNANRAARTVTGNATTYLNLRGLTVNEDQARTLFFRVIPGADNAAGATNLVGLTDKSMRAFGDNYANIGPILYLAAFTNTLAGGTTNGWYIGARNGYAGGNVSNPIDFTTNALESGVVYNVWIDVTNVNLTIYPGDTFTVYIAKEGEATRTVLFQDYVSDRDPYYSDAVLGGMLPTLDKLIINGNNATYSAVYDDFYLSTGGYLSTVPRPYAYTGPVPGPVGIRYVGSQVEIRWTGGTLQQATTVTGPWADMGGSPASPLLVTPTGAATFYRTRL